MHAAISANRHAPLSDTAYMQAGQNDNTSSASASLQISRADNTTPQNEFTSAPGATNNNRTYPNYSPFSWSRATNETAPAFTAKNSPRVITRAGGLISAAISIISLKILDIGLNEKPLSELWPLATVGIASGCIAIPLLSVSLYLYLKEKCSSADPATSQTHEPSAPEQPLLPYNSLSPA